MRALSSKNAMTYFSVSFVFLFFAVTVLHSTYQHQNWFKIFFSSGYNLDHSCTIQITPPRGDLFDKPQRVVVPFRKIQQSIPTLKKEETLITRCDLPQHLLKSNPYSRVVLGPVFGKTVIQIGDIDVGTFESRSFVDIHLTDEMRMNASQLMLKSSDSVDGTAGLATLMPARILFNSSDVSKSQAALLLLSYEQSTLRFGISFAVFVVVFFLFRLGYVFGDFRLILAISGLSVLMQGIEMDWSGRIPMGMNNYFVSFLNFSLATATSQWLYVFWSRKPPNRWYLMPYALFIFVFFVSPGIFFKFKLQVLGPSLLGTVLVSLVSCNIFVYLVRFYFISSRKQTHPIVYRRSIVALLIGCTFIVGYLFQFFYNQQYAVDLSSWYYVLLSTFFGLKILLEAIESRNRSKEFERSERALLVESARLQSDLLLNRTLTHEMKRPMHYLSLVLTQNYESRKQKEMIQRAYDELGHLLTTALEPRGPIKKAYESSGRPFKECLTSIVSKYEKTYDLHFRIAINFIDLEDVVLDNRKQNVVDLVFSNLLKNALEADQFQDSVSVTARGEPEFCMVTIRNSTLVPSEVQAAWEKSIHVDSTKQSGSGIGFATSLQLLQEEGGDITWNSVGNRTDFTLIVPKQTILISEVTHPQIAGDNSYLNLCVVDDDEMIHALIQEERSEMVTVRSFNHPDQLASKLEETNLEISDDTIFMIDINYYGERHDLRPFLTRIRGRFPRSLIVLSSYEKLSVSTLHLCDGYIEKKNIGRVPIRTLLAEVKKKIL